MLRRLVQLYIGLVLYGVSTALFVHANLGADPWDVFHLGVGKQFGLDFGTVIILTGAAVLLLWIPLRQMPGLGTVSNVIVLGLAANATLAVLPPMESLVAQPDADRRYRAECSGDGDVYWRRFWPRAARWTDDRFACPYRVVFAGYPHRH
jgi:hypothetical protein